MDPGGYQQRYSTQQQPQQQQQQQGQYGGYGAPQAAAGSYGQPPPSGFAPPMQQPQAALAQQGQPYDPQQTTQYSVYGGAPPLGQEYSPPLQQQLGGMGAYAAQQPPGNQQLYAGGGGGGGSFPGDQGASRYASGGGGGAGRAGTPPYSGQGLMAPPLAAAQQQGAVGQYSGQYQAAPGGQYLAPQQLQGAPFYGQQCMQSVAQQQPQQHVGYSAASSQLQGSLGGAGGGGGGGYASVQAAQGPYAHAPGALTAAPHPQQAQQGGGAHGLYGAPQQAQQRAAEFTSAAYDPRRGAAAPAPVQQAPQYHHQQQYQPVYAGQDPSAAYAPVAASVGGQHAIQPGSGGPAYAAQPPQEQRGKHAQQAQQQYVQYAAVPAAADVAGSRYDKGERGAGGRGGKTKRPEPANARASTYQPPSRATSAAVGRRGAPGGGRGREQQRWEAPAPAERIKHPQKQQQHEPEKRSTKPPLGSTKAAAPSKARRQSPAPAKLPPPPPYGVRAPSRPLGATPTLEYLEVERRHERLHMAHDFSRLVGCWAAKGPPPLSDTGHAPLCRILDLTAHMPTVHEVAPQATEGALAEYEVASPSSAPPGATVYNAKVVLVNGMSPEERVAALLGGGEALARRLRLVVARAEKVGGKKERTGIFALGGRYDPTLDGEGDPATEDAPLIAAATRHVCCQVGVDLAPCSRWVRFAEVHYRRLDRRSAAHHAEVTVVFLVADATAALLPRAQEWPAVWVARQAAKAAAAAGKPKSAAGAALGGSATEPPAAGAEAEKEEEEGELPADGEPASADSGALPASVAAAPAAEAIPPPHLLLAGVHNRRLRLKTMSISLDGLLDYDESDKEEGTFELSLFAEQLQEVVCRDAGDAILRALLARRTAALAAEAAPKRKAEQQPEAAAGSGAAASLTVGAAKRVKKEAGGVAEDASAAPVAAAAAALPAAEPVASKGEPASRAECGQAKHQGGAATEEATAAADEIRAGEAQAEGEAEVEAAGGGEVEDIIMLDDDPPSAAAPAVEVPEADEAADGSAAPAAGTVAAPPAAPAVPPAGELIEQSQQVDEQPAAKATASAAGLTATAPVASTAAARTAVDEALLLSFRYFDSTGAGWYKAVDLQALIESLGRGLNHSEAKELVGAVVAVPGRKQERVYYRELCTKEVAANPAPAAAAAAAVDAEVGAS